MSHACSYSSHLLAVGSKFVDPDAFIHFFDLRSTRKIHSFSESMSDDVTQLSFHPYVSNRLLSGSADGIACIFDLVKWDEDEDLTVSMPAGTSINKLGWFGNNSEYVWLATHAETFSLWTSEGDLLKNFGSIRQYSFPTSVEYIVSCVLCPITKELYVISGSNTGEISLLHVQTDNLTPLFTLLQGHTDIIRDASMDWKNNVLYTGGEDAKLIAWGNEDLNVPLFPPSPKRNSESNPVFDKVRKSFVPYHR
ncbi:WD repeat-containing protein 89 [Coelomomyces lativittatus]|nr:WD repeat-containing protein 89 [Coelomomyces lativittatus]